MSEKYYLVDGSGYIFRAFYAVAPLKTKDGFPTNALFGYTRMLLKLLQEAESNHVVVVFDAGRETFRTEMYPEYKANRSECPEDLLTQMPYFTEISKALGLKVFMHKGYEADDIIGTLATRLAAAEAETIIVTGDKDMMQLVGPHISIWDTMRDKRYQREAVKEKMGVYPEKIADLLGIMGDSSDNIPGLKGAGPKTAVQLLEKYGDIDTIIAKAAEIAEDSSIRNRKKISQQIELDSELLRLSKKLAQIDLNVPVTAVREAECSSVQLMENPAMSEMSDPALAEMLVRLEPDKEKLIELVERFEFGSLLKDFKIDLSQQVKKEKGDWLYKTIYAADFPAWLEQFQNQKEFSFDLETTSLDVLQAEVVGASFCWNDKEAYYLPLKHKNASQQQISFDEFRSACIVQLEDPAIFKIGQNLKYDVSVMARQGINVRGVNFDTMIAAYLLNPDRRSYNLSALAVDFLSRRLIEFDELGIDPKLQTFAEVEVDRATDYAAQDAHVAWLLRDHLQKLIIEKGLNEVFLNIEMPLIPVLSSMERRGVRLDSQMLEQLSIQFQQELDELQSQLYEMAGGEFNINSPKQLSEVLFVRLGISQKGLKKTKTGISTDSSVLEKLAEVHPLPKMILRFRTLHKLKSTYIDSLPAQVSAITGRLHTKFNQTVTGTGRLSSSDPNLQNIPIQTAEGRKIRQAFVADSGFSLISADYSQIELRILAHLSGDENLISAFEQGVDIHSKTAREIMGLPEGEEINADLRRMGKTINFGVIYGMSGFRLARELEIPVSVANQYIDGYFNNYPRVREFFARLEDEALTHGFVTTMFGRRRVISDLETEGRDKGFLIRAAINAPMQGTAADLIKIAMSRLDKIIEEQKLPLRMLLQIHDELVFECSDEFIAQAENLIKKTMESVITLRVPLVVDCGHGKNWQEAHA